METPPPALSVSELRFAYPGSTQVVLDIAALDIAAGERVFLRGPSGSGKSTLLGLIAGILEPGAGCVTVLGHDMGALRPAQRDALRARELGVIFQMFNLLPYLPVGANIMLPCRFSSSRAASTLRAGGPEAEARRLMARLGLDPDTFWASSPAKLSVGQQQRVAAARALIGGPRLILADEPTSALDSERRDDFLRLLLEECNASGAALLFVSHDASLAPQFDRALDLAALNRVPA